MIIGHYEPQGSRPVGRPYTRLTNMIQFLGQVICLTDSFLDWQTYKVGCTLTHGLADKPESFQIYDIKCNCLSELKQKGLTYILLCFQQIEKYRALATEIMGLPSIEHYDMIRLDCEDLKAGLAKACRDLADELLSRVSADHRSENEL